ncbi:MAG: aquaporin [Chloroflexi bacterium]|nr:MAG: aquaporin [Chloroflexota bacterium]
MTGHVRALLAEVAGTFLFFFVGAGAILAGGDIVAIALAHGLGLSVAVSSFGALSGGHFNPAVTFGLAVAGKHPWSRVATYWLSQAVGGLAAGFALRYAFEFDPSALSRTHVGTPGLGPNVTDLAGIIVEAILTILLLWAVFGTAVSPLAPRIGGFGIGLMVAADILAGGPITGAAMNPARWLGTAVPAGFYDHWFVYFIGPLLGAAIAGLSYRFVFAPPPDLATSRPAAPVR